MYDPYLHLTNMDVTNKEEINQVFPWSTDVPSICKVLIIREANKK